MVKVYVLLMVVLYRVQYFYYTYEVCGVTSAGCGCSAVGFMLRGTRTKDSAVLGWCPWPGRAVQVRVTQEHGDVVKWYITDPKPRVLAVKI